MVYKINKEILSAIADAIRAKSRKEITYTPEKMAAAIESLPFPEEGYYEGYDAGYQSGVDGYYDAFWDFYQKNGNRTGYIGAFNDNLWDDTTFKPKYDIVIKGDMRYTFANNRITDLKGILERQGVTLDVSGVTNTVNPFLWCQITRLPVLDFSSCSFISFYVAYLVVSIDKIILKQDGSQTFNFNLCNSLVDITFEGVIGQTVSFANCPLSKASIENILSVLSTTSTGKTVTFKKAAVEAAFTTEEWNALTATKTNWTYTLM